MTILFRIAMGVMALIVGLMAWGGIYAATHAALNIEIDDAAPTPAKGAVLELFDEAGAPLATAVTVEPWGYLLAQQPGLGDCRGVEGKGGNLYAECFRGYSRWASGWATRTRYATVRRGQCVLTRVPVSVTAYGGDWAAWWFPLQHGAGLPYTYITMRTRIDSANCARA